MKIQVFVLVSFAVMQMSQIMVLDNIFYIVSKLILAMETDWLIKSQVISLHVLCKVALKIF